MHQQLSKLFQTLSIKIQGFASYSHSLDFSNILILMYLIWPWLWRKNKDPLEVEKHFFPLYVDLKMTRELLSKVSEPNQYSYLMISNARYSRTYLYFSHSAFSCSFTLTVLSILSLLSLSLGSNRFYGLPDSLFITQEFHWDNRFNVLI